MSLDEPSGERFLELVRHLQGAREAEKRQALFYRALAAQAEEHGDAALSERFNELHADEQHHVSRLTARLLEVGTAPPELSSAPESVEMEGWRDAARAREQEEVLRYEELLEMGMELEMDETTRALVREILETERHHAAELGGKWTTA